MSTTFKHLEVLYSNPFVFAPTFVSFLGALGKKPNGLLLSYLVLPLVNRKDTNRFLRNAKSTSSLFTMARERDRLYGLNESVRQLRSMTNLSLQYAIDRGWISIESDLSASVLIQQPADIAVVEGDTVAATKLAGLLAPYDVRVIYRTLGIREV